MCLNGNEKHWFAFLTICENDGLLAQPAFELSCKLVLSRSKK